MIEKLNQDLDKVAAESKELPPSLYAELALHMARALQTVLDACLDMSTDYIEDVVEIIGDILKHYLRCVNYPSNEYLPSDEQRHFDNWIWEAPLFLAEFRRQRQDLEILEKNAELSRDTVTQLRYPKEEIGIDPIGSGLLPANELN